MKSSRKNAVKVKICGLTSKLSQFAELNVDYVGFIFYSKSPRYVIGKLRPEELSVLPAHIKKVGVFVNEKPELVVQLSSDFNLDFVQLHGAESPDFCQGLQEKGLHVIKAFGVGDEFDFNGLKPYVGKVSYFLFDTATAEHGGSGRTFNWSVLKQYPFNVPIFLGGGVGIENLESLLFQDIPQLHAVDLNSKLEISPGLKDIAKVQAAVRIVKGLA